MNSTACRAIASSASVGGASPPGNSSGASVERTRMSISSMCNAWRCFSPSPNVRGYASDTSTTSSRSGSAPARCIFIDRATGVQRQGTPAVGVGRSCDGRHHARRLPLEQRTEAAEVGGRELDIRARAKQRPLERAEEARTGNGRPTARTARYRPRAVRRRRADPIQSSRSPSVRRKAGGWPGPSGMPSVSSGLSRAAACSALSSSGIAPDLNRYTGQP